MRLKVKRSAQLPDDAGVLEAVTGTRRLRDNLSWALSRSVVAACLACAACIRNPSYPAARMSDEAAYVVDRLSELQPSSIRRPIACCGLPAPTKFVGVTVYYGTDRVPTGDNEPNRYYGTSRGSLKFGQAVVTVPMGLRPGDLKGPRWYLLEFKSDPTKHVALQSLQPRERSAWISEVRAALDSSPGREALVVVHGFRENFEHALRRTAQLAYDLNFTGVPVAYSWPTQGTLLGYMADEATSDWTAPHLRQVLQLLKQEAGVDRLFVLAHSMGSRVIASALTGVAATDSTLKLEQLILAAPDVDRDVFESRDAVVLKGAAKWLTLYASSQDEALKMSRRVHGYPRAGLSDPPLVVLDSMDTIDASQVDTDIYGHGYFSENKAVIDDLFMLIRYGFLADGRNLSRRAQGNTWFYAFR